jgi:2',3'-cyclic-nucleotide 2'-phosphodiesterase (5'-nucleotidase family)
MGKWRSVITRFFLINFIIGFFLLASCEKDSVTQPPIEKQSITIFYTNDEHGWMEPFDDLAGGASGMLGRWKMEENYDDSDAFLVLSGGDMWTGPALSSWFNGESMVEIMNAMGYDAAALGNHEFDFSVSTLNDNTGKMNFPILSANIVEKGSGNIPSFVEPYMMIRSGEVDIGIIGLSSLTTPYSAFPKYVEDFEFTAYDEAIDAYAPKLQDLGAEIILIIGHICEQEMIDLVPVAKKYNISVIGGGHCHQIVTRQIDGIALMQAAAYMAAYTRVELEYFPDTKEVNIAGNEFIINENGFSDQSIESLINDWRARSDSELTVKIGFCVEKIEKESIEMGNMVVDSWFFNFPDADVSVTNSGGIRQDIPAGDISVETIVGLLPFENTIYELDLTGAELLDCSSNYLIGGMTTLNGNYLSDGTPIHSDSIYQVLTTDYLYSISSNRMSEYDPDPEYTSVNYRQPLIDWLKSLSTSSNDPLENHLDYNARK